MQAILLLNREIRSEVKEGNQGLHFQIQYSRVAEICDPLASRMCGPHASEVITYIYKYLLLSLYSEFNHRLWQLPALAILNVFHWWATSLQHQCCINLPYINCLFDTEQISQYNFPNIILVSASK